MGDGVQMTTNTTDYAKLGEEIRRIKAEMPLTPDDEADVGGMAYTPPPTAYMEWRDKKRQEAKADAGKPDPALVPTALVWAVAVIRGYGNMKYPKGGKDNWKQVEPERYRSAMYRHLLAYIDDPYGVDEESGYPHLWHLATNCAFLCELERDKLNSLVERLEAKDD